MQGKTVLITGGNAGIGKETARAIRHRGARVIVACRNVEKGKRAAIEIGGEVDVMPLDLASFASIRSFAAAFLAKYDRLDVFIANAGLMVGERRETAEGFEMTFGVNHLGHFLLTELLL